MTTGMQFDLADPLDGDITVIEASAGTGKTYALASLAVRLLAAGEVDPRELLIVTFTKAATAELRQRIRQRLLDVAALLGSEGAPPGDPLIDTVRILAGADDAVADRITQAVTDFDEITVSTIHGFAQQVLGTFGLAAQVDPDLSVVGDDSDLVNRVCANTLAVAALDDHGDVALPALKALIGAVNACQNMTDLVVRPAPADVTDPSGPETTPQALLARLIASVRLELLERRRAVGQRNFADLLTDLRDALERPGASAAIATVRSRYQVALIDEFQDTDPVQWEIFTRLFGGAANRDDATIVVVGDPKQAIYRFRGADINAYLRVVGAHPDVKVLGTNWRADKPVVDAFNGLFAGATFGPEVGYLPVEASPAKQTHRLWLDPRNDEASPVPQPPGLVIRLALHRGIGPIKSESDGFGVPALEAAVRRDLAARLIDLFDHGQLDDPPERPHPVGPADVAVLVTTHREADEIQAALQRAGIPAVVAGAGSVFSSDAANQWRLLLTALAAPSNGRRARAAALTVFGAFDSATDLANAADDVLAGFQQQLGEWARVLVERGVAEFVQRVRQDSRVTSRVLARPDGDRLLTDLEHLGDLFQVHHGSGVSSPVALLEVLNQPPGVDEDAVTANDEHRRRVETDADAVQIMTIHTAKGLEFPIVCCPSLFKPPRKSSDSWAIYDDPDAHDRILDLEPKRLLADGTTPRTLEALDDRDERLRLAYVALTRACHQTIVWWGHRQGCQKSPLARLLFARDDNGNIDPEAYLADVVDVPPVPAASTWVPSDPWKLVDATKAQLEPFVSRVNADAGRVDPVITVEGFAPDDNVGRRWTPPEAATPVGGVTATRGVASFDRTLDHRVRRWSFSAITARGHDFDRYGHDAVDEVGGADEGATSVDPVGVEVEGARGEAGQSPVDGEAISPLATLPAGPAFGVLVHKVLELVDFTDPNLSGRLAEVIARETEHRMVDLTPIPIAGMPQVGGATLLRDGLEAVTTTPLGAIAGGITLARVAPIDRRNELGFELLLGAADVVATDTDIGRLVLAHLDADDPYRGWATELADGRFSADLVGHLTGEIDLVLRVHGPDGPRFVIVDYKTNRLHKPGRPPGADDYDQAHMAAEMAKHHYPLQALLYSVALHRYLRWRLVGYDPRCHLGGAAYLFVRGMAGEKTPTTAGRVQGVCDWMIPPDLVAALSALLDGRRSEEVHA